MWHKSGPAAVVKHRLLVAEIFILDPLIQTPEFVIKFHAQQTTLTSEVKVAAARKRPSVEIAAM